MSVVCVLSDNMRVIEVGGDSWIELSTGDGDTEYIFVIGSVDETLKLVVDLVSGPTDGSDLDFVIVRKPLVGGHRMSVSGRIALLPKAVKAMSNLLLYLTTPLPPAFSGIVA